MLKDFTLKIGYRLNGVFAVITASDQNIEIISHKSDNNLKVLINAKENTEIIFAQLSKNRIFGETEKFFANGYQSWTTSREFKKGDKQKGLMTLGNWPIINKFASISGSYDFTRYGKNLYHSFGYSYIKNGEELEFYGTLNDRTGYTIIYADMNQNKLLIEKDVEGLFVNGQYELFNIASFTGSYDEVFDRYFDAYPLKSTGRIDFLSGYTSWYNYFQNINEKQILRDLEGMDMVREHVNIFQIDDGYETAVGDWDLDKAKFPNGMTVVADQIKQKGFKAGLWIAPFSAQRSAKIVKQHKDWFIKKNGRKMIAGVAWNGFYALDIELPEVREYIKKYFDQVFNDWGFDMVKLDFLYSICIIPRHGKTRGQLMFEGMDFLRECCGDKLILGCGVPIIPSFGYVDACRISCDVELSFKDKFYVYCTGQEIISAKNAINNTIFRRHLDGRIFANDPDVFFLRDDGMKPAVFTMTQKKLLAKINNMFGSVLFVSDDATAYDSEKFEILKQAYTRFAGKVIDANYVDNDRKIEIVYALNNQKRKFVFDTYTGENSDIALN